jgi:hypothetical protein
MASSGMLCRVALVRTDLSEEQMLVLTRATRRNISEDAILQPNAHVCMDFVRFEQLPAIQFLTKEENILRVTCEWTLTVCGDAAPPKYQAKCLLKQFT